MDSVDSLLSTLCSPPPSGHAAFTGHKLVSYQVQKEQLMGYSGACVCELHCVWEPLGPPETLFMKHIVHAPAPDPATQARAFLSLSLCKHMHTSRSNSNPLSQHRSQMHTRKLCVTVSHTGMKQPRCLPYISHTVVCTLICAFPWSTCRHTRIKGRGPGLRRRRAGRSFTKGTHV